MNTQLFTDQLRAIKGVNIKGNYIEFNSLADLEYQVLPNFKLREFLTKNTGNSFTVINIDLMLMLNNIRNFWGSGIKISSSYRSKEYNKSINGAASSQHVIGNALDIYPSNGEVREFQNEINKLNLLGGVGFYNTFVHIDTRGYRARWDERK